MIEVKRLDSEEKVITLRTCGSCGKIRGSKSLYSIWIYNPEQTDSPGRSSRVCRECLNTLFNMIGEELGHS